VYQDEGVVAPSEPVEGPSTSFLANCFAIRSIVSWRRRALRLRMQAFYNGFVKQQQAGSQQTKTLYNKKQCEALGFLTSSA
jgi:hypothetical protein